MAQEKAEYKQRSSRRNLDCLTWTAGKRADSPLGNPTCTCTALNRNILAKFISLPSSPFRRPCLHSLQLIYIAHLVFLQDYHRWENSTASDTCCTLHMAGRNGAKAPICPSISQPGYSGSEEPPSSGGKAPILCADCMIQASVEVSGCDCHFQISRCNRDTLLLL